MPNLQQIISLRKKYAPKQQINDDFNLGRNVIEERRKYIELEKAITSKQIQPLLENLRTQKEFSVTPEKQTSEIIEYFEKREKVNVVLLFIDITGFSTKTRYLSPIEVTNWLDDYYHKLMPIIYSAGGEIEKIMGDGIICIFGKPFLEVEDIKEKYIKAESCARKIIKKFFGTRNEVKIALHNGPVIYYKTPVEYYEEYTMIGNTLTELYRLESVSKKNSINYFAKSHYAKLTKYKALGINIKNETFWEYSNEYHKLQGIEDSLIESLTRIQK